MSVITNADLDREVERALAQTEHALGMYLQLGKGREMFVSSLRAALNAGDYEMVRRDGTPHVADKHR